MTDDGKLIDIIVENDSIADENGNPVPCLKVVSEYITSNGNKRFCGCQIRKGCLVTEFFEFLCSFGERIKSDCERN